VDDGAFELWDPDVAIAHTRHPFGLDGPILEIFVPRTSARAFAGVPVIGKGLDRRWMSSRVAATAGETCRMIRWMFR